MSIEKPIMWLANPRAQNRESVEALTTVLPPEAPRQARSFHRQIPGYHISPLKSLPHLAARLGLGGIWVKDESARLNLGSFKVLGGSFAIYQLLKRRLGLFDMFYARGS
jgi:diaminopropionate ammonia-lyase